MEGYKHYIRLDSNNNIVYGFSDAFEQPQEGDICINENGGRHFELNGVINPSLAIDGIYRFKYVDGEIVEKTSEEIEAEKAALPPPPKTEMELLKEQLEFTQAALDFIIMNVPMA